MRGQTPPPNSGRPQQAKEPGAVRAGVQLPQRGPSPQHRTVPGPGAGSDSGPAHSVDGVDG